MKRSAYIWIGLGMLPATAFAQLPPPPPGVPLNLEWFHFLPALIMMAFYFTKKKTKP